MGAQVQDALHGQLQAGQFLDVLADSALTPIIGDFVKEVLESSGSHAGKHGPPVQNGYSSSSESLSVATAAGLAAFNAFLQINVTGPALESTQRVETLFTEAYESLRPSENGSDGVTSSSLMTLRSICLKSLDVDGVSVYPYIPNIELFCLARWVFSLCLPRQRGGKEPRRNEKTADRAHCSLHWLALRIYVWHYKLLTQPSLGPGSIFNRGAQWSEVPSLQESIEKFLKDVEREVMDGGDESSIHRGGGQDKVQFLLEKANICVMLGWDTKAKEAVKAATELNGFTYALSGALGKRTRFQEKSTSQLVVLAKSASDEDGIAQSVPEPLPLNDETLLENIEFSKRDNNGSETQSTRLPAVLKDLPPEEQPQLSSLDQIILLTEATLKDAFSPVDTLTSEEILPYAVRVISDRPTNWQIYTQALLVRSRIEVHRSRTVERGVLQMQAVVDQVIVDATSEGKEEERGKANEGSKSISVPAIEVTSADATISTPTSMQKDKPISFFPTAKPTESAPPQVRLQYIHALSSPPRWHLESELAYAWAGVGSLVSALEIFKRLRLWAEVALCLASSAASDDDDGRGSGGEEKARAILRWRLFHRMGTSGNYDQATSATSFEDDMDISDLNAADFTGPERTPPPPNAPRLFCILGDVENEPRHYKRAWELSNCRYARAQKSLGEHYLQQKDWESARDAYKKAVAVNRLSPELWSRLGDISLRLGAFADAAEAFWRAIGAAGDVVGGEDARTWSNLGSALYSLYVEAVEEKSAKNSELNDEESKSMVNSDDDQGQLASDTQEQAIPKKDPATLLTQSLAAYKRGAAIAHDNWRIWDNVITLASRVRPPVVPDILLALKNSIAIRASEDALDEDVLRLLLTEAVLSKPKPADAGNPSPRGSTEKAVCDLLELHVVPLITKRSELWELVSRERVWRGDFAGAIDASEKAWRAAVGGAGGGTLGSAVSGGDGGKGNWLVDREAWMVVVARTDELVSVLENYGHEVESIGSRWKGKAKSAVRSVLGKARESWEGGEGWVTLEGLMEGLK